MVISLQILFETRTRFHREEAVHHITHLYSYHIDKDYFFASYLDKKHWFVFVIFPKMVPDSLMMNDKRDESHYLLSEVIRKASRTSSRNLSCYGNGYRQRTYGLDAEDLLQNLV
ncbi:hypothetical protein QVD17_15926 [Tagetes erecta]|uniref:Uncharacterized protein n=1 Tax=Tagetes erecta TaxID=13708 RepID=A0AAD8KQS0_TARER|nr:hypothetical protein QVD17_15926 [Tagetes erecta]